MIITYEFDVIENWALEFYLGQYLAFLILIGAQPLCRT